MQDGSAGRPAVPAEVVEGPAVGRVGPAADDWRIAELALPGATGELGWVALRLRPFEVLPLCEDCETALLLARQHAWREGVSMWTWRSDEGWRQRA